MASWLVAAGLVAAVLGQADSDTAQAPDREAIRRAVGELGDARFSVREAASRFLWRQGAAAEADLQKALQSDDPEVAYRARRILSDFRYGILPGVSDRTLATIRQFRVGDAGQRLLALQQVAAQEQTAVLRRLFKLEAEPNVRRQIVSWLLQRLPVEPAPGQADRLALVLDLIVDEPEKDSRAAWLSQLFGRPDTITRLVQSDRLEAVLALVEKDLDVQARSRILQRLFQSPPAVEALLSRGGIDRLLALAAVQSDSRARGQLLAALITSTSIQQKLEKDGADLAIELARQQKDPIAQGEYFKQLLSSSLGYQMLREPEPRTALWELIKTASEQKVQGPADWRVDVLLRMLSGSAAEGLFEDPQETQWLIRFAREAVAAEPQAQLLERLIADSRIRSLLVKHGRLEALLDLTAGLPPEKRGPLRGRLVASSEVSDALAAAGRLETLVRMAEQEPDAAARADYLAGLFANVNAMTGLIDDGCFDALWEMVRDEHDPARGAILRGEFICTAPALEAIRERGRLETLLDFARDQQDLDARRDYLERLFGNSQAISLLVEAGHFDALVALVRDEDRARQAALQYAFYSNSAALGRLIETGRATTLVRVAEEMVDDQRRFDFLYRVLSNSRVPIALVREGQLDKILSLVRKASTDPQRAASLLHRVFTDSSVVESFVERNALEELFRRIDDHPAEARHRTYEAFTNYSAVLPLLIEQDRLDLLLDAIRRQPDPEWRGRTLATVMEDSRVTQHLRNEGQIGRILQIARDMNDEQARLSYLERIFSQSTALYWLLDGGHFDALHALCCGVPDARARLLAQLLANRRTAEHLAAAGRIGLVLETAAGQEDEGVRRTCLHGLVNSREAVAAVVEDGRLDRLIELCRSDSDAQQRRRMLVSVLRAPEAGWRLAEQGRLHEIVHEVLHPSDADAESDLLEPLLTSVYVVDALVDQGLFAQLHEAATAVEDPDRRWLATTLLLTAPKAILELGARDELGQLIGLLEERTKSGGPAPGDPFGGRTSVGDVTLYLRRFIDDPKAVKALSDADLFDPLMEIIRGQPEPRSKHEVRQTLLINPSAIAHVPSTQWLAQFRGLIVDADSSYSRRQAFQKLLSSAAALEALSAQDTAEEFFALLESEPEATRHWCAIKLLASQERRQTLVDRGLGPHLVRALDWLSDDRRPDYRTRLLNAPSGIVAYHMRRGERQEANRRLEEFAHDDPGRLHLAAWLLATGGIDRRIAAERRRLAAPPQGEPPGDARLLAYLLRAKGDPAAACDAAERTEDPGLRLAVLAEAGRWSEAADLQAAEPCPLPIPTNTRPIDDARRARIEQFSLAAAYGRLAGREDCLEAAIGEIRTTAADSPDAKLRWFAVEALLLNDRAAEGLRLLAETDPARAFDLLVARREYRAAFELAGWKQGVMPDHAWLESLSADGEDARQSRARIEFALKVARTLRMLGRPQDAEPILDLLEAYVAGQPDNGGSSSRRRYCWERLCLGLVGAGYDERAWEAAARAQALSGSSQPPLLYRIYVDHREEAQAWWKVFRKQHPSEPTAQTFRRVHHMFHPPPDEDAEAFDEFAAEVVSLSKSFSEQDRQALRLAVGRACLDRGRLETACRFLEPYRDAGPTVAFLLGDTLRRSEQWPQAADAYQAAWQQDHDRPAALYLAGDALERAGREEEAEQLKAQAELTVLAGRDHLNMTQSLFEHGLDEPAVRHLNLALRTAPPGHWEWHEAARLVGDRLAGEDPAQAAAWLEQALLDDLRTQFYLLEDTDYLRNRATIHRLRAAAAVREGRFQDAERAAARALAALPGDVALAETLVPLLDQAGRRQEADALLDTVARPLETPLGDYPDSAALNNDLGWLLARCGRRPAEAVSHARRAVELDAGNAAYVDTLAEAHFRRGDREAAVRSARRAAELRPGDAAFQQRLEHFRSARLP